MSNKYRILRKPFQQAPPSSEQREQVKMDLSGAYTGYVMTMTNQKFFGAPPNERTWNLQPSNPLYNPALPQSYLIEFATTDQAKPQIYYNLTVEYVTRDGPRQEILKLQPDQTTLACPSLILTFFPYDVNNPKDTSRYSYFFTSTHLDYCLRASLDVGMWDSYNASPQASNGRWVIFSQSGNDQITPYESFIGQYFVFDKSYSDYSFYIQTVIPQQSGNNNTTIMYSNVTQLSPIYMHPNYPKPLSLYTDLRDHLLPAGYL